MPINYTPTAPTPAPTRDPSLTAQFWTWLDAWRDQVRRDFQALPTALAAAAKFDAQSVSAMDGDEVEISHGLGTSPDHVSLTISGGDGRVELVSSDSRTVTVIVHSTPASETRTVSIGLFA